MESVGKTIENSAGVFRFELNSTKGLVTGISVSILDTLHGLEVMVGNFSFVVKKSDETGSVSLFEMVFDSRDVSLGGSRVGVDLSFSKKQN